MNSKQRHIRKHQLKKRDGLNCCYCKKEFKLEQLTIEHIIPNKRGWDNLDHVSNLKLACRKCNFMDDYFDKMFNMDYRLANLRGFFNPNAIKEVIEKRRCFYHEQIKI
jgi:5-methylcytosine-specific restriction endonuclease McrA